MRREYRQARAFKNLFNLSDEGAARAAVGLHGDTKDVQAALERDDAERPRASHFFTEPPERPTKGRS